MIYDFVFGGSMKRNIIFYLISLICGILFCYFLKMEHFTKFYIFLGLSVTCIVSYFFRFNKIKLFLLIFSLGFLVSFFSEKESNLKQFFDQEVSFTGEILNSTARSDGEGFKHEVRLKNIETAYIRQEQIKANKLDEIFQLFEESENWTYTVAWIDCLQKGENIGRSIMMRGEHALKSELPLKFQEKALELKKKFTPTIPFYFPNFILNTLSVKIFNWIFFNKQKKEVKNIVDYKTFFYPLDIINDWNKIYGKKGFIQYQMIIPKKHGKEGMKRILETIAKSGQGSFLAVLKLYGASHPQSYNSFPIEGYSVALDFKINSQLKQLVSNLDNIVEEFGGRIYLTKDSMSKPSLTNYLKNTDSTKFVSLQSKRIKNNY